LLFHCTDCQTRAFAEQDFAGMIDGSAVTSLCGSSQNDREADASSLIRQPSPEVIVVEQDEKDDDRYL